MQGLGQRCECSNAWCQADSIETLAVGCTEYITVHMIYCADLLASFYGPEQFVVDGVGPRL